MPAKPKLARPTKKPPSTKRAVSRGPSKPGSDVGAVLRWLERKASKAVRDGMARYAIPSDKAFGISVGALRAHAKALGRNHDLALALWDTGFYEARMLATFLADPERVTPAQMDAWCRDFDNWAICDTACFQLFDRTPHAFAKVKAWARSRDEFVKRAAFALLSSLTVHDKQATDAPFEHGLALIEKAAQDERNFVAKAVNWALRSIGKRNAALNVKAVLVARRLGESAAKVPRWIGKDALRELTSAAVQRRLRASAARLR